MPSERVLSFLVLVLMLATVLTVVVSGATGSVEIDQPFQGPLQTDVGMREIEVERPASAPIATRSGNYIVLTTMGPTDPYYQAAQKLSDHRSGTIIRFDPNDLDSLKTTLITEEARYVALVMKPWEMHVNFTRSFLMMSTGLDDDPFSDFSYGFITGATGQDAENFVDNIILAETMGIQDYPFNVSGWGATTLNFISTFLSGTYADMEPDDYSKIYLEANDTGVGVDYFHTNKDTLTDQKLLSVGENGDPHMLWLFEGGNMNPNPPSWTYDEAKIENPAYARRGLTSRNVSTIDMFPAVAFNGACHSGVPKHALVERDIEATFGDTQGIIKFYNMSDDFSFCLAMLKANVTGYFAPNGANNANDKGDEVHFAMMYHEPLGDIHKRTVDGVVMGCLGNSPKLRIYEEDDLIDEDDLSVSGTYDPADWGIASQIMLGGKANRIYYGDPMFDPYAKDHSGKLNYTTAAVEPKNETQTWVNITCLKPDGHNPLYWDKFHHGDTKIYLPVELPEEYSNVTNVQVTWSERPYDLFFYALEEIDGKTILHTEIAIGDNSMGQVHYNYTIVVSIPPKPKQICEVDIEGPDKEMNVLPGSLASYNVNVWNLGNGIDTIRLGAIDTPEGWSVDIEFNGSLMPVDGSRKLWVNVTTPASGLNTDVYMLQLNASSAIDPDAWDVLNITTGISAVYGVNISCLDDKKTCAPGGFVHYDINVTNTGNAVDDIIVTATSYLDPEVVINTTSMAPGEWREGYVNVSISGMASGGSVVPTHIEAASATQSFAKDWLDVATTVSMVRGMELSCNEQVFNVTPGDTSLLIQMDVTNIGNGIDICWVTISADSYITISYDWSSAGEPIDAGDNKDLDLYVELAEDVLGGKNLTIEVTASSNADPGQFDTYEIYIHSNEVIDLYHEKSDERSVMPGSSANHSLFLENQGNVNISLSYSVTSSQGWLSGGVMAGVIGPIVPSWSYNLTLTIDVPHGALDNTIDYLNVTLKIINETDEEYHYSARTIVKPYWNFTMTSNRSHATIRENGTAEFELTILSNSNCVAEANLWSRRENDGIIMLSHRDLLLSPGESHLITVAANMDGYSVGTYTIWISLDGGPDISSIQLIVIVEPANDTDGTEPTDEEDGDGSSGSDLASAWFMMIFIILAIFVVIAVIAVVMLMLRRRNYAQLDDTSTDKEEDIDDDDDMIDHDEDTLDGVDGVISQMEMEDAVDDEIDDDQVQMEGEDPDAEDLDDLDDELDDLDDELDDLDDDEVFESDDSSYPSGGDPQDDDWEED